jgi:hypothetical protein
MRAQAAIKTVARASSQKKVLEFGGAIAAAAQKLALMVF